MLGHQHRAATEGVQRWRGQPRSCLRPTYTDGNWCEPIQPFTLCKTQPGEKGYLRSTWRAAGLARPLRWSCIAISTGFLGVDVRRDGCLERTCATSRCSHACYQPRSRLISRVKGFRVLDYLRQAGREGWTRDMPLAEAPLFQVCAYDSTLQVCRWVWDVHCQPS